MNYKLSGRYKFYSTIINVCFVSIRESNNEEIMKKYDNSCIVVSGYGSTTKSKNMFNSTVDYFQPMFTCTIYVGRMLGHVQLYGGQGIEGGGIEDRQKTRLKPSGIG